MKVCAYKDVEEAVTVAKASDGRLIQVDSALAFNLSPSEQGWLVAANATDLYDANGLKVHARVRCYRPPEAGDKGHFALYLEKADGE